MFWNGFGRLLFLMITLFALIILLFACVYSETLFLLVFAFFSSTNSSLLHSAN